MQKAFALSQPCFALKTHFKKPTIGFFAGTALCAVPKNLLIVNYMLKKYTIIEYIIIYKINSGQCARERKKRCFN